MNKRNAAALLAAITWLPAGVLADVKAERTRSVEIRGAGAMQALAQRVAEGFMSEHPDAIVTVAAGGAHRGVRSVVLGTADIGLSTDFVPEELEKVLSDRKIKIQRHDVYSDALAVVVHKDNPVDDIPLAKLRDVYRGAITSWRALDPKAKEDGKAKPKSGAKGKDDRKAKVETKDDGKAAAPEPDRGPAIVLISHEGTSGTYETFKRQVLGDEAVVSPRALITNLKGFQRAMGQSPHAIGYIGLQQASDQQKAGTPIKVVAISGVLPSAATVQAGQYPIRRKLSLYTADPPSPLAGQVVDYFLVPDKGQAIVRQLGDVPVK
jgi:phosphate transport system substrate-binding protein